MGTLTTTITDVSNSDNNTTHFLSHSLPAERDPSPPQPDLIFTVTTWMWLLWPPIIIAMGTTGNVLTIAVLTRMGSKGGASITLYLLALSWSDLVVLYAGLLRYWVLEVGYHTVLGRFPVPLVHYLFVSALIRALIYQGNVGNRGRSVVVYQTLLSYSDLVGCMPACCGTGSWRWAGTWCKLGFLSLSPSISCLVS